MKQRLAIIGSGIAGLASAWMLSKRYDVTLIESNGYVGGHTHTIEVDDGGRPLPVDTGFIVYNVANYPLLTRLFEHLNVPTREGDMSFSASIGPGRIEYASDNLNTVFAQRGNLLRPAFLRMLADLLRFNRRCKQLLSPSGFDGLSLGEFLDREGFGTAFRDHYLLPMAAAIWSCPARTMMAFPAESLARFFDNHGLLNIIHRPLWRTVVGGSHAYVKRLLDDIGHDNVLMDGAVQVRRLADQIEVQLASGASRSFDKIVLACHADQALALLERPNDAETRLLSRFRYQDNRAYLHTDTALMPQCPRVWASWNYLAGDGVGGEQAVSVTYWMNRLQGLATERQYLVSLNPLCPPATQTIIATMTYEHPVFDSTALIAQQELHQLQGQDRIWYCGSYFGYGFHEDALKSAVDTARVLNGDTGWIDEVSAETGDAGKALESTKDQSPHRIFFTRVMHKRLFPVQYRFEYRVFSLLLDLDALAQTPSLLSLGRRNLFRFEPRDHGPRDGSPLRPWAERLLAARGIALDGGRIWLLCFPRLLGYGFSPLSLWYCEHSDGSLRAVIAEVNNTFGEHHCYLLSDQGRAIDWPLRDWAEKCFHVSPLMDIEGGYHFRLSRPDAHLAVLIRYYDEHGRLKLVATQTGAGEPLTNRALLKALRRMPLMTFKVMVMIHWQALKIWLSGARYFPKPDPPHQEIT
jgi:predicted NAD/FAD-binding protein